MLCCQPCGVKCCTQCPVSQQWAEANSEPAPPRPPPPPLQVFSTEEMSEIERLSDAVDAKARAGLLPESCFHSSYAKGGSLKRTKYFFGARWACGVGSGWGGWGCG